MSHLLNIQPNLKFHPPTKTFWIRSCIQRMIKCDVTLTSPHCKILGYARIYDNVKGGISCKNPRAAYGVATPLVRVRALEIDSEYRVHFSLVA